METLKTELNKQVDLAIKKWLKLQSQNHYVSLYLYYKPYSLQLDVAENKPPGFELAMQERIPKFQTKKAIEIRIRKIIRTLPILPN